jgi:5-methylcytosine-specific restriction endonuclease McrA
MAVLILNTDDTALHTVSVQHAIGMLVRKVAVVEAAHPELVFGSLPQPEVLRLVRYVKTTFLYNRVPGWTKRGVLKRDRHSCGYCGEKANTVDHILPISRGGRNTWTNTVAACHSCNTVKANRTPKEASMPLRLKPYAPSRSQLMVPERMADERAA